MQATALQQRLDTLLADPRFQGSQVGLVVRDATTGETLYDRDGGTRLLPASNTKLFTSTAALHTLGAGFRFDTDVLATAPVRGGKLRGDLYLQGVRRPDLARVGLRGAGQAGRQSGVQRIDGDLIADDTYFDKVRLGDSWSWDDEPFYYSAQISAADRRAQHRLRLRHGDRRQRARRDGRGAGATRRWSRQTSVIKLVNTATTGAADSDNTLTIERDHATNVVGVIGLGPGRRHRRPGVGHRLGADACTPRDVFRRALAARGIQVDGTSDRGTTPRHRQGARHGTSR